MKTLLIVSVVMFAACGSPAPKLTESEEYFAGRAVASEIIAKYSVHPDDDLQAYVNLVGHTVAFASDRPEIFSGWTFVVIQADEINAICAASGHIFITTGFLRIIESEDELAAILAHEVGHVCFRHPELELQKKVQAEGGSSFFKGALNLFGRAADRVTGGRHGGNILGLTKLLNNVSDKIAEDVWKGYAQKQEYEADLAALDYLVREEARYNPNALVDILRRIAKLKKDKRGGFFNPSTHPRPEERIQRVLDYIRDKGYGGVTNPNRTQRWRKYKRKVQ